MQVGRHKTRYQKAERKERTMMGAEGRMVGKDRKEDGRPLHTIYYMS